MDGNRKKQPLILYSSVPFFTEAIELKINKSGANRVIIDIKDMPILVLKEHVKNSLEQAGAVEMELFTFTITGTATKNGHSEKVTEALHLTSQYQNARFKRVFNNDDEGKNAIREIPLNTFHWFIRVALVC